MPIHRLRRRSATWLAALAVLVVGALVAGPAQAKPVNVTGQTTVALSTAAQSALAADGITVTPIAPATSTGPGSITLPIARGRVAPESLRGFIVHKGGVKFAKGSKSATVRHFVLRHTRRATVLYALVRVHVRRLVGHHGKQLRRHAHQARKLRRFRVVARIVAVPVLRLHDLEVTRSDGKVTVTGSATLTRVAARYLDRKLDTKVFKGGAQVGTVTVDGAAK